MNQPTNHPTTQPTILPTKHPINQPTILSSNQLPIPPSNQPINNTLTRDTAYLRFSPPSLHSCSSPSGRDETKGFRCACSNARHISSSEYLSNGSRFI